MKFLKYFIVFVIVCFFLGLASIYGMYKYVAPELPDVATIRDVRLQTPMQVFSADDKLIAQFGEQRRIPLEHEQIPDMMVKAFIATEDSRFYEHHGIDPVGIARAVVTIVKSGGHRKEGASTITQQLARNYFLTPERTLMRKIREAFLAIKIEQEFEKDEILELYVNKIFLGYRAYGVGAAAYVYFGKEAKDLTLSEIAVIAGLPKAPSNYNPLSSPQQAKKRRDTVLFRMLSENYITQAQFDEAMNEPIVASYHEPAIDFSAPYLAEMVRQEMVRQFGEESAYSDGFKVYTTISKNHQLAATAALQNNVMEYEERHGYRGAFATLWKPDETALDETAIIAELKKHPQYGPLRSAVVLTTKGSDATALLRNGEKVELTFDNVKWGHARYNGRWKTLNTKSRAINEVIKEGQAIWLRSTDKGWRLAQVPQVNSAIVSVNPQNGALQALVGGFDFNLSKFNRVTQSIRQAGSSIKPFIYAAALDKGMTLATILNDLPITRYINGSENWSPKNSPNVYEGPLRLRVGIGKSKNVMIVRAMRAIGVNYAADYLERFGFVSRRIERTESLSLGAATVTPLQMARGYAVFSNGGYLVEPYFIERIEDVNGKVLFEAKPKEACQDNTCDTPVIYGEVERSELLLGHLEDVTVAEQEEAQESGVIVSKDASVNEEGILEGPDLAQSQVTTQAVPEEMLLPEITLMPMNHDVVANVDAIDAETTIYAPHVISREIAFLMSDALRTNIFGEAGGGWLGTGWRARTLERPDIGGKTGTTNQMKDAWFVGYAPGNVAAVWVGFDDHRKGLGSGEAGAQTAEPAWINFMTAALKDVPVVKPVVPEGISEVTIDMRTGKLSNGGPGSKKEYFIKGTEPTVRVVHEVGTQLLDKSTGQSIELF